MMEHLENLAPRWFPLLQEADQINGVVATTLSLGFTRPVWNVENSETQSFLMVWPEIALLRTAALVHGTREGKLDPVFTVPLLEGFPNPLSIVDTYGWQDGFQGEVLAQPNDDGDPLWFYDPLFYRDKLVDLTPGVTQMFYLAGLCSGIRRALLDDLTITTGPNYEEHAKKWLEENPGKTRLDVPLLKIPLAGVSILGPGQHLCEYQARCKIFDVDSFIFGPPGAEEKIYRFGTSFGKPETPTYLIMYAPERVCLQGYEPKEDHEIDVMFWMQGRIVDDGDEIPDSADASEEDL